MSQQDGGTKAITGTQTWCPNGKHAVTFPPRTIRRHQGVLRRGRFHLGDALVQVDVAAVDVGQPMLDRAPVLLPFDNFLLDMMGIQRRLRVCCRKRIYK